MSEIERTRAFRASRPLRQPVVTYRTGYLGRGATVHVLTLTPGDPFYRSLCQKRWTGGITTLGNPIESAAEQTGELAFIGCKRCHSAFSRVTF